MVSGRGPLQIGGRGAVGCVRSPFADCNCSGEDESAGEIETPGIGLPELQGAGKSNASIVLHIDYTMGQKQKRLLNSKTLV